MEADSFLRGVDKARATCPTDPLATREEEGSVRLFTYAGLLVGVGVIVAARGRGRPLGVSLWCIMDFVFGVYTTCGKAGAVTLEPVGARLAPTVTWAPDNMGYADDGAVVAMEAPLADRAEARTLDLLRAIGELWEILR